MTYLHHTNTVAITKTIIVLHLFIYTNTTTHLALDIQLPPRTGSIDPQLSSSAASSSRHPRDPPTRYTTHQYRTIIDKMGVCPITLTKFVGTFSLGLLTVCCPLTILRCSSGGKRRSYLECPHSPQSIIILGLLSSLLYCLLTFT